MNVFFFPTRNVSRAGYNPLVVRPTGLISDSPALTGDPGESMETDEPPNSARQRHRLLPLHLFPRGSHVTNKRALPFFTVSSALWLAKLDKQPAHLHYGVQWPLGG